MKLSIEEINLPVFQFDIDNSLKLVILNNDSIQIQVSGLDTRLLLKYKYVTDPPIIADIGEFELDLQSLNFIMELKTLMDNSDKVL